LINPWLRQTLLYSLLFSIVPHSHALGYLAGEFGSAQSYKEGNSFLNSFRNKVTLSDKSYGKVYEWGLAIGGMLSESNSVEFAYNSRKKYSYDKYTIAIDGTPATGDQKVKFLGRINNSTFMLIYNYDIIKFKRIAIGLNTGYGWSYNKVSNLNEYLPNSAIEGIINKNNQKTSAYSFGVKVNFTLTESLQLVVGYRYSNLGKFASGVSYSNVNNSGALSPAEQITGTLKVNEAYLRLAFYFDG